jgi:hypothetical protein
MSLTMPDDMAILPRSVLASFISANIRARTGNAVMDSETLMKSKHEVSCTFMMRCLKTEDALVPIKKGSTIPAPAMTSALLPHWRITAMSISTPMRNKKYKRPRWATVSSISRLRRGKTPSPHCFIRPITDGPNMIPAWQIQDIVGQVGVVIELQAAISLI